MIERTLEMPFFSITISPPPRPEGIKYLYDTDIYLIRKYLNKFSRHYIIFPEIALATSRLHYHGVIDIHDPIKFHAIRHILTRTLGYIKVDPLKDHTNKLTWIIYCMKEWASTRALLKEPIIYQSLKRSKKPTVVNTNYLDEGITKYFKLLRQDTNTGGPKP